MSGKSKKTTAVIKQEPPITTGGKYAKRDQIIEYYETLGNRSRTQTLHHFRKLGFKRNNVYKVLQNYHLRRKKGYVAPQKGPRHTAVTPENIRRYEELCKLDPLVRDTEACQILNISKKSLERIRKAFFAPKNNQNEIREEPIENEVSDHDHDPEPEEPIKVKLRKGKPWRCLSCFQQFEESLSPQREVNKLTKNLNAIFVLRRLLDLTPEDILDVMKLSKWRDPENWFNICEKCNGIVEECLKIHEEIRRLEGRLEECKEALKETIRNTSGKQFNKKVKGASAVKSIVVTNRVRKMVLGREGISRRKNPFEEGDKEAEVKALKLVSQSEIVVKQEIEDVPIPVDHLLEFNSCDPVKFESWMDCSDMATGNDDLNPVEPTPVVMEALPDGNSEDLVPLPVMTQGIGGHGDAEEGTNPLPVPVVTLGICDVCGVEMRPLALPMHKFTEHDFVMDGYTAKYCKEEGCNYKTLYDAYLKMHTKKHHTGLNYICRYCGKKFKSGTHRNAHEEIHKNAETRPFQCELCGASFAVKQYLYHHKRISHQRRYFPSTKRKRSGVKKPCH